MASEDISDNVKNSCTLFISYHEFFLLYTLSRTMQIFLLIWVITHINYYGLTQHYSLTWGCVWERAIVTYFRSLRTLASFTKWVNQSAHCIKLSFKPMESFCKMPRANDSNWQSMSVVELFIEIFKKRNCPNQLL